MLAKLKPFYYKTFNLRDGEGTPVALLLFFGFVAGVFTATFDVSASALFLSNFGEKIYLPLGIIAQGVVGILITSWYGFFQSRFSFSKVALVVLLLISLLTAFIRLEYSLGMLPVISRKVLIFSTFSLMLPFNNIMLLIFWGLFGRIFTIQQQRRTVGGIDLGKGFATLFAFFAIPLLSRFVKTIDFLWISAIGAFITVFIVTYITYQARGSVFFQQQQPKQRQKIRYPMWTMFADTYIRWMVLFVIVASIAAVFLNYVFLTTTSNFYPNESQLTAFLGLFGGLTVIFAVLTQTFVADRLVEMYGIRVVMLINPLLALLFVLLSLLTGVINNVFPTAGNLLLVFLSVALCQLFFNSLRDAFDEPTFKMYTFPIDSKVRLRVTTRLEGNVKAFAGLLGGGILLAIDYLHFTNLLWFLGVLFFLILLWLVNIQFLHRHYRETLQNTLAQAENRKGVSLSQADDDSRQILAHFLEEARTQSNNDPTKADQLLFLLRVAKHTDLRRYEQLMLDLEGHSLAKIEKHVRYEIDKSYLCFLSRGKPDAKSASQLPQDWPEIQRLARSEYSQNRIRAAMALRPFLKQQEGKQLLISLLKDLIPEVRLVAIHIARIEQIRETWELLAEQLAFPVYAPAASAAFIDLHNAAIPILEPYFSKSINNPEILTRIIHIYGQINSPDTIELLWRKIQHPHPEVTKQILLVFSYCNIEIPPQYLNVVYYYLEAEIGDAFWDLVALHEIEKTEQYQEVREALKREIEYNFTHIFRLLSLIYESTTIQLVRDSFEIGDEEGRTLALELMNLFVEEKVKQILFPILEDISIQERIRKLRNYFPRERKAAVYKVLESLIIRDFRYTNRWTRAVAILALVQEEAPFDEDILVATVFHPDVLLQETALRVLYERSRERLRQIKHRIPPSAQQLLQSLEQNAHKAKPMGEMALNLPNNIRESLGNIPPLPDSRVNLVRFLAQTQPLANAPLDIISEMADFVHKKTMGVGKKVLIDVTDTAPTIYLMAKGVIDFYHEDEIVKSVEAGAFFGEIFWSVPGEDFIDGLVAAEAVYYEIDSARFFDLLLKYPSFLKTFLHNTLQQINTNQTYHTA
ncbi:hypothetical protein [Eisenibacter elegans]|jgi:hypothetical protein|uniref:hypothetical protein n=1 Tax=Eisenibacter elegans TaxID=997 RepID=UPI000402E14B|nr:hypothetical protein [Eisenibacter elegans]